MNYKKIALSFSVISALSVLNAYEMKPLGYKAVGMGGAGVASSRGSFATYYNPALLGFSDYTTQISLDVGVSIRENKLMDTVDELNELKLTEAIDEIADNAPASGTNGESSKNIADALEVLNKVPNGNGLQLTPSVSLSGQFSRYFGFGIFAQTELRAKMVIDKDRLNLIIKDADTNQYFSYDPVNDAYNPSTEASYKAKSLQYALEGDTTVTGDETTYLSVNALSVVEVPLSFAYPLETTNGRASIGLSVKPMIAETFSKQMAVDSESDDIGDDYDKNKKSYTSVGLDLGYAYQEAHTGLTLAIVGKNINKPVFETEPNANGVVEKFELEPFFRGGLSLPIWNDNVELAIDADFQQSDTSYEGMKSQYIGGGLEFHPVSWFTFRTGAMKNVAAESLDEGMIYTAGVGFGLKWLQLDISAQVAQKTGRYDGEDIPKYASVNFALVSKWGDGYQRKSKTKQETPEEVVEPKMDIPAVHTMPEVGYRDATDIMMEEERLKKEAEAAQQELEKSL